MRARLLALASCIFFVAAAPAAADVSGGGVSYDPASAVPSGGASYGSPSTRVASQPSLVSFLLGSRRIAGGTLPAARFRIDQAGTPSVVVRIAAVALRGSGARSVSVILGPQPTGQVVAVRWPAGTALRPGRYRVQLHATDPAGHTLLRRARAAGAAVLTVTRPRVVAPQPAPAPAPVAVPAPVPPPVLVQTTDGVFPVQGAYTYGDPFGAARSGHIHQGQDILAASGLPVVAPTAGTITSISYQAGGAGYYVVEHSADGRDFFFAHCRAGSTVVAAGQAVAAGALLCAVGMTGDATGPHLHFEIWVGGWHAKGGQPIDPIDQLHRWGG